MRLSLSLATRFLKSNKIQTVFIVLGIAVGIAVQLFIGELIYGLQQSLINKTIGDSPQIIIKKESYFDNENINKLIKSTDNSIDGVTEYLDSNVLLSINDNNTSLLLRGIDYNSYNEIYNIDSHLKEGNIPINDGEILLSMNMKDKYKLKLNDNIKVIVNSNNITSLKVTGFYKTGITAIDDKYSYTSLSYSEKLLNIPNKISEIAIGINNENIFNADKIASKIKQKISSDYSVNNWKDQNEDLLSGLQGQSISSIMIQIFVLVSVVLGISSVLAITVMQKSKQIGILKAMGIKDKCSGMVFLLEGLILGFLGAITGVVLGILLLYSFMIFAVNPDGSAIVEISIRNSSIFTSFIIAVISAIMASLIPAIKSSRLNPIEIIRNN